MPTPTSDAALLAGARSAFEKYGYSGTTIERIATEAGLSRATLHRRGVTRDGLLAELVAHATEDYRRIMWPAVTGVGTAAERLAAALDGICHAAEQQLPLLVALRAQSDGIFHGDGQEEALTRSVFTDPLERLLRDGAADGTLRDLDPLETATVLFNLVGWTYIHLRTGHGWRPERARRTTIDPVLNGLLATGERARA